jgi:hypothetical protein
LEFEPEAILLHLEDGKVVSLHQVDDRFDVFEFQGPPGRRDERLGKAFFAARSSKRIARPSLACSRQRMHRHGWFPTF